MFDSNFPDRSPINIQPLVEIELHGLDEQMGFDVLATRHLFLQRLDVAFCLNRKLVT